MKDIKNTIFLYLPKHSQAPNGWFSFNCPVCIHFGHRPDQRKRGGLIETPEGGFKYNCFNCKFKAGWNPGQYINKKTEKLLEYLNIPKSTIEEIKFETFRYIEGNENIKSNKFNDIEENIITTSPLPEKSVNLVEKIEKNEVYDKNMLFVVEYLYHRNPNIFSWTNEIYWSPKYPKRAIFAKKNQDKVLGWTARDCSETMKSRYLDSLNTQHLFNMDKLFKKNRGFVIITEGIMDAIACDGVAVCGTSITEHQSAMINKAKDNKEIVLVPDRDKDGRKLVEIAKKQNWSVSFPSWERGIKDIDEAVREMGRLFCVRMILESKESNKLKIDLKSKEWFV